MSEVGRGEAWISPMYWRMKVPGLRSLVAKSPDWPFAGCEGLFIGVIFAREHGPLGVFGGMSRVSGGFARRAERWVDARDLLCIGAVR